MQAQIVKRGNGQGIRIPKGLLQELGLKVNDTCSIRAEDGMIVIEKAFVHRTLEERATAFGGKLGPYEEYDWGEPVGREVW